MGKISKINFGKTVIMFHKGCRSRRTQSTHKEHNVAVFYTLKMDEFTELSLSVHHDPAGSGVLRDLLRNPIIEHTHICYPGKNFQAEIMH